MGKALQNDPSNSKFRTIDKNTPGYQSTLSQIPSAEDLLLCVKFQKRYGGKYGRLIMERSDVDMALLWIAVSSLENSTQTKEYQIAKKKLRFQDSIKTLLEVEEQQVSEKEIMA